MLGISLLAVLVMGGCNCRSGVYDDTLDYYLPFTYGTQSWVGQGNNGVGPVCEACSHFEKYAIDFVMPEGTLVLAARGGAVLDVRDSCPDVSCPWAEAESPECCGNYMIILHEDQTMGRYWHLMPGGVCVEIGDLVERGDGIGLSGNTGRSMMPHLHYQVDIPDISTDCVEAGCEAGKGCGSWGCSRNASTQVSFADVCGDGVPAMGWTYTSQNEAGFDYCGTDQE